MNKPTKRTTKKTPSTILNAAADLLEKRGIWIKGTLFRVRHNTCQVCAHGAILYCAIPSIKRAVDKGDAAKAIFACNYRARVKAAPARNYARAVGLGESFNDAASTTKKQVINKLREAARIALKAGE